MNFTGIFLALSTLVIIRIGFFWVIKLEYHLGARSAPYVMATGILIVLISLFVPDLLVSALLGIFGGSVIWGATELPDQEERVSKGHFPANPRRKAGDPHLENDPKGGKK